MASDPSDIGQSSTPTALDTDEAGPASSSQTDQAPESGPEQHPLQDIEAQTSTVSQMLDEGSPLLEQAPALGISEGARWFCTYTLLGTVLIVCCLAIAAGRSDRNGSEPSLLDFNMYVLDVPREKLEDRKFRSRFEGDVISGIRSATGCTWATVNFTYPDLKGYGSNWAENITVCMELDLPGFQERRLKDLEKKLSEKRLKAKDFLGSPVLDKYGPIVLDPDSIHRVPRPPPAPEQPTPTPAPSTPEPTKAPTPAPPTPPEPTEVPTSAPTASPEPTEAPTAAPTATPKPSPTPAPFTPEPTEVPTPALTTTPVPTEVPTSAPTISPEPTEAPGPEPTVTPAPSTPEPTEAPTPGPTTSAPTPTSTTPAPTAAPTPCPMASYFVVTFSLAVGPQNETHWENVASGVVTEVVGGHLGLPEENWDRIVNTGVSPGKRVMPGCNASEPTTASDSSADVQLMIDVFTDAAASHRTLAEAFRAEQSKDLEADAGGESVPGSVEKRKGKKNKKKDESVDVLVAKFEALFDTDTDGKDFGKWLLIKGKAEVQSELLSRDPDLCGVSVKQSFFGAWKSRCEVAPL